MFHTPKMTMTYFTAQISICKPIGTERHHHIDIIFATLSAPNDIYIDLDASDVLVVT